MDTRREVTKDCARRYAQAKTKKARVAIVDEVVALMGWRRKHAIRILGGARNPKAPPGRRDPSPAAAWSTRSRSSSSGPSWTSPVRSASRWGCATSRTPSSGRAGSGSRQSSSAKRSPRRPRPWTECSPRTGSRCGSRAARPPSRAACQKSDACEEGRRARQRVARVRGGRHRHPSQSFGQRRVLLHARRHRRLERLD